MSIESLAIERTVKTNPENPCPDAILAKIISLELTYLTPTGEDRDGIIEVHQDVAQDVHDFFELAYERGFPIHGVVPASAENFDDASLMQHNLSSGFNYRTITGQRGVRLFSAHALGRAIDVNPLWNPYTSFHDDGSDNATLPEGATYNPNIAGTFTTDHPLVHLMHSRGWQWGGDWTKESGRIDRHHFQKSE